MHAYLLSTYDYLKAEKSVKNIFARAKRYRFRIIALLILLFYYNYMIELKDLSFESFRYFTTFYYNIIVITVVAINIVDDLQMCFVVVFLLWKFVRS